MKVQRSIDRLKQELEMLKLNENLSGISDEGAYLLYRIIDTIFDWLLKEYELKITRVMLHKYDLEVEKDRLKNRLDKEVHVYTSAM